MASATTLTPTATRPALHSILPPLILGTATFNHQYVSDPHAMPYRDIVARALELGVNAFDTSPYYGPSETLLGSALDALMNPAPSESNPTPVPLQRSSFTLVTKCGRIVMDEFDYSPAYIRYSVLRSLQRLHTPYLDLVYAHDVEFVSPGEVLAAVRELRRLRDEEGLVRYVGISGFPVDVLCDLAAMVYKETGEPLDAVLSYGHFTIQNRKLGLPLLEEDRPSRGHVIESDSSPLARFKAAGVDVVLNASILGMGLLTSRGIPADPEPSPDSLPSPLAKWHPSPPELRLACKKLAAVTADAGERLESVAIRWALDEWARVGGAAGLGVTLGSDRVGATVCGVSSIAELEETVAEWEGVLSSRPGYQPASASTVSAYGSPHLEKVMGLVQQGLWPSLGPWKDFAWESPGPDFVNTRREQDKGIPPNDGVITAYEELKGWKSRKAE